MVEKAILNPDYTVFCLFKHSKNLSGWMSGEGKYRKEKANEKGKELGKQLGVPFLAISSSCLQIKKKSVLINYAGLV